MNESKEFIGILCSNNLAYKVIRDNSRVIFKFLLIVMFQPG